MKHLSLAALLLSMGCGTASPQTLQPYVPSAPVDFGRAVWIGAITNADSHLPQGHNYTGRIMKTDSVKAAWKAVDTLSSRSIVLRRDYKARRKIASAQLAISGLGFYKAVVDGQQVGQSEFAPLWSYYDKTVYYNVYDLTAQLKGKRQFRLDVTLGNGFYNVQGGRYKKYKGTFGAPTMRCALALTYRDGSRDTLTSDTSWQWALSPYTFNCIYGGEDYDARIAQQLEQKVSPQITWHQAVRNEGPRGRFVRQDATDVRIMSTYAQPTIDTTCMVYDFHQNLSGFPGIRVRGQRGQTVRLIPGENLDAKGRVTQAQTGRPHYYKYTLRGDGEELYIPAFSYYGYRYLMVEGAVTPEMSNPQALPVVEQAYSYFVHNSAREVGRFEGSNDLFNQTHRLITLAMKSNFHSVFTDCPHREKLGWLEQDHLNGPGLFYNFDLVTFIPKLMQDIVDAQYPNGKVPTTAPEYVVFEGPGVDDFEDSPEWGCAIMALPFLYLQYYGDDCLIRTHYGAMKHYVAYLTSRAEGHLLKFGLGDWYDYGDFKAGFSRNTPVPLVATAHYYLAAHYWRQAAQLMGNAADEAAATQLLAHIRQAFNAAFYQPETHLYGSGSQCSLALPLYLNLVPSGDEAAVLAHLEADIEKHGCRLTTGDVGNRYLIQTLARYGKHELIYRMFNHYDTPGYGFQLRQGATTLTEQWDPRNGASWNHFMMGQIEEWFYASLLGIQPDARLGYRKTTLAPYLPLDMTYLKGGVETTQGTFTVELQRQPDGVVATFWVPKNVEVNIQTPYKTIKHEL